MMHEDTLEQLITKLQKDQYTSEAAIKALSRLGTDAVPRLIIALKDKNELVRAGAATALGEIADKRALQPLIQTLTDSNNEVRAFAALSLGYFEDSQLVSSLVAILEDPAWEVREASCCSLREIGDGRALSALQQVSHNDDNENVREAAAEAIAAIQARQK